MISFGVYAGVLFKIYKSPDFSLPWISRIIGKAVLLAVPALVEAYALTLKDTDPVTTMIFGSAIPSIINGFLGFANVETLILKFIGVKAKVQTDSAEKLTVYTLQPDTSTSVDIEIDKHELN